MIRLHDRVTGEDHVGKTAESIARRVWGKGAMVDYSGPVGGVKTAMVTKYVGADRPRPRKVLAQVCVYGQETA